MDERKHDRSLDHFLIDLEKNQEPENSEKLSYSKLVDAHCLDYLNLLDYEVKRQVFDSNPFFSECVDFSYILEYCCRELYLYYKEFVLTNGINQCDEDGYPFWIIKFINVALLYNVPADTDESLNMYFTCAYSLLDLEWDQPSVMLSLWRTLCESITSKVAVFSKLIYEDCKPKDVHLLQYMMRAAYCEKFDFWGAWTNDEYRLEDFNYCPVTAALMTGCVESMFLLLQYGFEPNFHRFATYDENFIHDVQYPLMVDRTYYWLRQHLFKTRISRKKVISEVLIFLVGIRRCKSAEKRMRMTKCFNLLWGVLPTPYVTLHELRSEACQLFRHLDLHNSIGEGHRYHHHSNHIIIKELCDDYASICFCNNIDILQPRPLMHLSKCVIRKQLRRCLDLPFGVNELGLPERLKSYLQVETSQ